MIFKISNKTLLEQNNILYINVFIKYKLITELDESLCN